MFASMRQLLSTFKPLIVANQVVYGDERRIRHALGIVCRQYLGIEPVLVSGLPTDTGLAYNIRRMRAPISDDLSENFKGVVRNLVDDLVDQPPFDSTDLLTGLLYATDDTVWLEDENKTHHGDSPTLWRMFWTDCQRCHLQAAEEGTVQVAEADVEYEVSDEAFEIDGETATAFQPETGAETVEPSLRSRSLKNLR